MTNFQQLFQMGQQVQAKLSEPWQAELARRTGREIRLAADPALALESGFAQAVPL